MSYTLIIDDDPRICLLFTEVLKELDLEFETANSLGQARVLFENRNFDLVLLDLELPDGNGLDLMPEFTALPAPRKSSLSPGPEMPGELNWHSNTGHGIMFKSPFSSLKSCCPSQGPCNTERKNRLRSVRSP